MRSMLPATILIHSLSLATLAFRFFDASNPSVSFEIPQKSQLLIHHRPIQRHYPEFTPQLEDRNTLVAFAKMCHASYHPLNPDHLSDSEEDDEVNRHDMQFPKDITDRDRFGWDGDQLRGHVFVSEDTDIVIIAFKGTSTLLGGGDTILNDKFQDNLMFSCCCARVDFSWTPICGCYNASNHTCDRQCVQETINSLNQNTYYHQAESIYARIKQQFPNTKTFWLTGHSLGGAIASLLTVTHPKETVAITFSSPGPVRFARNLGLTLDTDDDSLYPIYNFGLSSDPIFTGSCTGPTTSCYLSGYAMETACRFGFDCKFQVDPWWTPDVVTHRMNFFLENVLEDPERPTPVCVPNRNCNDCSKWSWT